MYLKDMTQAQYKKYVEKQSPNSPLLKNVINAFVVGGLICIFGQLITDGILTLGIAKDIAAGWTSITLIFLGALLTGLGIYDKIAKFAGAGTIVPITGFANSIVSPAMEHKSEGFVLGMSARMFIISGPVLVFGTVSSCIAGLILWIFRIY